MRELHTKLSTRIVARAISLALLAPLAAWGAQTVPGGTPVTLEFMQEVSSKTAHEGDTVKLRVYTDVVVDGKTVIRQDSVAEGVVAGVHRRRSFGRKGELRIQLQQVRDVKGTRVPLESYTSGNRFGAAGPGAAGAGLLVFGPVGAVAGVFVKGTEITIKKGTRIQAQVAGERSVEGDRDDR
jgi:hypothetical protein